MRSLGSAARTFKSLEGKIVSDQWGQPQQPGGGWSVPQSGGESGSFAPPPVDPQYGAAQQPQPQYGVPQQPQYGAAPQQPGPQFGAVGQPQYGGQQQFADQSQFGGQPGFGTPAGPAGYGGYIPPEYQKNGFSIAGFWTSPTVVLGLIFSILGLSKSGKVGGKGRGLAIAGIVLSIAFLGGYVALGVVGSKITVFDPGCNSIRNSFNDLKSKLETDASKLESDAGDQTAMQTDLTAFTADIQTMKSDLDNALSQAQQQSVKDKLKAMDDDTSTVLTGLQAIQNGDTSQLGEFEAAAGRLGSDGSGVDSVCSL